MAENKRTAIRHIRDGIKSKYPKGTQCAICATTTELDYHHYTTISLLLKQYAQDNNLDISSDEGVLAMRDRFYADNWNAVVEDGVTLCNEHHILLHKIYGREPPLSTSDKQKTWVARMSNPSTSIGRFGRHKKREADLFSSIIGAS